MTARMAVAVDDLSDGRLTLGLGAGWQEREHHLFGFDLLDKKARFARFEEGMECMSRLLRSKEPVTFEGHYYQFHEAQILPHPLRPSRPPLLVGGNGFNQTLSLAARYGPGGGMPTSSVPEQFEKANHHLDALLSAQGRAAGSVRRSMMTVGVFAKDDRAQEKARSALGRTKDDLRKHGIIAAAGNEIKDNYQILRSSKRLAGDAAVA